MDRVVTEDKNKRFFYISSALLLLVYLPVFYELVLTWYNDANYSHGFLIPIVSGFLLWKKREQLAAIKKTLQPSGLIIIFIGLALFVLGNAASEYFTVRVSLIITLFGLVLFYFGAEMTRKVWFEILFLLFMIPIPYVLYFSVTFPMQLLASKVSVFLLDGLGMPVIRQGNMIHLANQSLEVAEACSGLRSLISLLALGAIYSYLTQKRFAGKIILFLSTIPIAMLGNIFRVFITSLIVYTFEIDATAEPLHTLMGLSVFVVAFILLFIFGAILRRLLR